MKTFKIFFTTVVIMLLASSCSKTYLKINYLQDLEVDKPTAMLINDGITVQPQDQLSIIVTCINPELSAMFNLVQHANSVSGTGSSTGNNRLLGYVVDNDGDIDFPVIGKIHVAGLTRWGLQEHIKNILIEGNYIKEPTVTVTFLNFKFSVLGEVGHSGTYTVDSDKITIFTALSMAGDLSIYGLRDQVYVIREQDGERVIYQVDLRSTEIFNSPAYCLKQNDVIYVTPSKVRAGQSTINENNLKSISLWTGMASLFMSIVTFLVAMNVIQK